MALAGYLTKVRISGTPTVSTGSSLSTAGGTSTAPVWSIDSTVREIFDRSQAPAFFAGGSTISSTAIRDINYLFGKVTFNSTTVIGNGVATIDVTYMPMTSVAGANSYSLTQTQDVLDDTDFTSTGFRSKHMGLADVNLTISRWDTNDIEFMHRLLGSSTGSTLTSKPLVAEVNPGGSTFTARGWFILGSESRGGDVASLEASDLTMEIDGNPASAFRWHDQ